MHLRKRAFDLFFSSLILIMFALPILLISLVIICVDGKPIFFLQDRLGKNCKAFRIIKFRTMSNEPTRKNLEVEGQKFITPIGQILRKTSLDEIPSFLNVLFGDMSVVGPRPLLIEYENLYSNEQVKRHQVKPGMTGLAQVRGRNNISWSSKFRLDVMYVKHQSFCFDLKIIIITIFKVVRMDDIYTVRGDTPQKFRGSS